MEKRGTIRHNTAFGFYSVREGMSLGCGQRRGMIHVCFNRPALPTISKTDYKWDEDIHEGETAII